VPYFFGARAATIGPAPRDDAATAVAFARTLVMRKRRLLVSAGAGAAVFAGRAERFACVMGRLVVMLALPESADGVCETGIG
jgi:hypothetical protein